MYILWVSKIEFKAVSIDYLKFFGGLCYYIKKKVYGSFIYIFGRSFNKKSKKHVEYSISRS